MGRCCVRSRTIRTSPGSGSGRQSRAGSRRPHTTRDYTCGMLAPVRAVEPGYRGVAAPARLQRRRTAHCRPPWSRAAFALIDTSNASAGGEPVCMPVALPENAYLKRSDSCPRESCFYAALAYDRPQVCDDAGVSRLWKPRLRKATCIPCPGVLRQTTAGSRCGEAEPVAGNLLDPAEPSVVAQAHAGRIRRCNDPNPGMSQTR